MFSKENKGRTDLTVTDEGFALSSSLISKGYIEESELDSFQAAGYHKAGVHPVIECTQNIPCNPCQDACPVGCIVVGDNITSIPALAGDKKCTGCGLCVASCSGQAIFLVNEAYNDERAAVTMPYEFLPYPEPGQNGTALDRAGNPVCPAQVVSLKTSGAADQTALLTIAVPKDCVGRARAFKPEGDAVHG